MAKKQTGDCAGARPKIAAHRKGRQASQNAANKRSAALRRPEGATVDDAVSATGWQRRRWRCWPSLLVLRAGDE